MPMDAKLVERLHEAVREVGMGHREMVSGAGHDAMIMADVTNACMLFIRCRDGVSHHPDEFVAKPDIDAALRAMVRMLLKTADHQAPGWRTKQ